MTTNATGIVATHRRVLLCVVALFLATTSRAVGEDEASPTAIFSRAYDAASRACQGVGADFEYAPLTDGLGVRKASASIQFAAPSFIPGQYFFMSPSFRWTEYETPGSSLLANDATRLYTASQTVGIGASFTDALSLRAFVGVEWSGDGKVSSSHAWRYSGAAVGAWKASDSLSWLFGVVYTDASDYRVIPFVGATWLPREDLKIDLTFPSPKIAKRLDPLWDGADSLATNWIYLSGGIGTGGGVFRAIGREHGSKISKTGKLEEREFRVGVGLESDTCLGANFAVETGVGFARKFERASLSGERWRECRRPDPTFYLKTRVWF